MRTPNFQSNKYGQIRLKVIDILRGTNILGALQELDDKQYWSKERLKWIEEKRLEKIINMASSGCAHYKNVKSYRDLEILTKETIKKNPSSFFSNKYTSALATKATGGSTGMPLVYYTTKEAQSYMWAGIIFAWKIAGYSLGDKVAFIAGPSLFKRGIKHYLFHKLLNIKTFSTFSLTENDIIKYVTEIRTNKIKFIYGYATALNRIAEYLNEKDRRGFPALKGIVSTAEVLTESHRKNIEKGFGVEVFNQYGCNEGGVSAFECEEKHLHLINLKCKYELDEENNLIATDLINEGFMMLRYFTGDKLIMSESQHCSCGRGFPVIEKVLGRSYDMVVDNNNKVMHAAFFNILFKQDSSIKQFQIQFDKNTICIYLNVDNKSATTQEYEKYMEVVKTHLCFNEYKLKINAPFLMTQNAKHKYVINTAA